MIVKKAKELLEIPRRITPCLSMPSAKIAGRWTHFTWSSRTSWTCRLTSMEAKSRFRCSVITIARIFCPWLILNFILLILAGIATSTPFNPWIITSSTRTDQLQATVKIFFFTHLWTHLGRFRKQSSRLAGPLRFLAARYPPPTPKGALL